MDRMTQVELNIVLAGWNAARCGQARDTLQCELWLDGYDLWHVWGKVA